MNILETENYIPKCVRASILSHIQEPNLSRASKIFENPYVSLSSRKEIMEMVKHVRESNFLEEAKEFIEPGTLLDLTKGCVTIRAVVSKSSERELEILAQRFGMKLKIGFPVAPPSLEF